MCIIFVEGHPLMVKNSWVARIWIYLIDTSIAFRFIYCEFRQGFDFYDNFKWIKQLVTHDLINV